MGGGLAVRRVEDRRSCVRFLEKVVIIIKPLAYKIRGGEKSVRPTKLFHYQKPTSGGKEQ